MLTKNLLFYKYNLLLFTQKFGMYLKELKIIYVHGNPSKETLKIIYLNFLFCLYLFRLYKKKL